MDDTDDFARATYVTVSGKQSNDTEKPSTRTALDASSLNPLNVAVRVITAPV